jgi:hypothetical protein
VVVFETDCRTLKKRPWHVAIAGMAELVSLTPDPTLPLGQALRTTIAEVGAASTHGSLSSANSNTISKRLVVVVHDSKQQVTTAIGPGFNATEHRVNVVLADVGATDDDERDSAELCDEIDLPDDPSSNLEFESCKLATRQVPLVSYFCYYFYSCAARAFALHTLLLIYRHLALCLQILRAC